MKGNEKKRNQGACLLRDWLFERLIGFLLRGEWTAEIKNLKYSKDPNDRKCAGFIDYDKGGVCFDAERLTVEVLVHELGHLFFGEFLYDEAAQAGVGYKKRWIWDEEKIMEFTDCFMASLTGKQTKTLQKFVNQIKTQRA